MIVEGYEDSESLAYLVLLTTGPDMMGTDRTIVNRQSKSVKSACQCMVAWTQE